jgi:pimeloyl-ACP methyl ester carboxylesterase
MRFFSLTKTNKKEAAEATAPASHHEDKKAKLTPLTAAIVEVHDVEVAGPDVVHGFVSARRSAKCTLWTTTRIRTRASFRSCASTCRPPPPTSLLRRVPPLLTACAIGASWAVDEPGYGMSSNPARNCSLEDVAGTVEAVADSIGLGRFAVAGSLMGCYTALSLAASLGDRVGALVLTHPYKHTDAAVDASRAKEEDEPTDPWLLKDDGSHLVDIWEKRKSWLSAELNTRITADELTYLMKRRARYAASPRVSITPPQLFPFEETAAKVRCKALVLLGSEAVSFFDMIGMKGTECFAAATAALPSDLVAEQSIAGGHINMVNTHTEQWVDAVHTFHHEARGPPRCPRVVAHELRFPCIPLRSEAGKPR